MPDEKPQNDDTLNLGRPFVEESETPLVAIYVFKGISGQRQFSEISNKIINSIKQEDIVIGDCDLKEIDDRQFVVISLSSSNAGISKIADLSKAGNNFQEFKDFVISTVPPRMIPRYKNGS